MHDVLLDSRTRQRGYFHEPVVRRLLSEHQRGVRGWHYQLWNLLMLELWHRTFVDGRPEPGPHLPTLAASGDAARAS